MGQVLLVACRWQQRPTQRSLPQFNPIFPVPSEPPPGLWGEREVQSSADWSKETGTHPAARVKLFPLTGPRVPYF